MDSEPNVDVQQLRLNARKGAIKASKKPTASNTTTYVALGIFGVVVAAIVGLLILHPEQPPHLIPALDAEYMEGQNALKLGYSQKANAFFEGWSLADVKLAAQVGLSQQARNMSPCTSYMNEGELVPQAYDLREEFPHCMQEVMSQGNCSAGYAFATAAVASERFCMVTNGQVSPSLSAQDLVACSKKSSGCTSGNVDTTWNYVRDNGLVENYCFPYASVDMKSPECKQKCDGPSYRVKDICATASEGGLMREIKNNGPVVAVMQLYSDFLGYAHGVYEPHISANKVHGAQAVEVVGWGTSENGVPYWIVKNSWGSGWGEAGYAQVIRGNKDLGIEDFAVTATPVITEDMVRRNIVQVEDFEDLDVQIGETGVKIEE